MLKAEDLMLGDWVHIITRGNDRGNFPVDDGIFEMLCRAPKEVCCAEPIPLTPEILEKNGFKYENHHGFRISSDLLYVCISKYDDDDYEEELAPYTYVTGGNSDFGDDGVYFYLNYVHELQHALRLCGIKKEIVL